MSIFIKCFAVTVILFGIFQYLNYRAKHRRFVVKKDRDIATRIIVNLRDIYRDKNGMDISQISKVTLIGGKNPQLKKVISDLEKYGAIEKFGDRYHFASNDAFDKYYADACQNDRQI